MKQHLYALLVVLFAATACSNEELVTKTVGEPDNEKTTFKIAAGMPEGTPATKLTLTEKEGEEGEEGSEYLEVAWSAGDGFSVFAGSGATSSTPFSWESNDETGKKAIFTGEMIPAKGTDYYAIYPVTTSTSPTAVSLNMSGQDGTKKSSKMFMYSDVSNYKNHKLSFSFHHLTAVLKLTLEFTPEESTPVVPVTPEDDVTSGEVEQVNGGGVLSRMADDEPVKEITFSAYGLLKEETVDITDNGTVKGVTKGDIVLDDSGNITLTKKEGEDKYTAEVFLYMLPSSLAEFTVRVKIGDNYYSGTISTECTIDKQMYYTKTVRMEMEKNLLGYIMLNDGTFVHPYEKEEGLTEEEQSNAIGVVAYMYNDNTPANQKVKYTATVNGESKTKVARGLVLALNDASKSTVAWASYDNRTFYAKYATLSAAYNGANGYTIYKNDKFYSYSLAIQTAVNYKNTVPAPSNTSGWYLPSQGEWIFILSSDGIGGASSKTASQLASAGKTDSSSLDDICTSLNSYLLPVEDYAASFNSLTTKQYLSASEMNLYTSWYVNFNTSNSKEYVDFSGYTSMTSGKYYVRSILAF